MLRSRLATAWCFASAAARLLSSSRPVTKPWIWRRSTGGRGGARSAAAGQWHQWCSVVAPAARQRAFRLPDALRCDSGGGSRLPVAPNVALWPVSRANSTALLSLRRSYARSLCSICAAASCPRGLLRPAESGGRVTRALSQIELWRWHWSTQGGCATSSRAN